MAQELREFKFVVQPVFAVVEGEKIVGEQVADTIVLYGLDRLREFVERFPDELANLNGANGEAPE